MFCREQVAQLRNIKEEIARRGANLVVVGNGSPRQAAEFREEQKIDFQLLTDPGLESYKKAGMLRSVASVVLRPRFVKHMFRALSGGHRQALVQGDAWQQGGAFVFAPGDRVLFEQRSNEAGDHVDPQALLAQLPS